MKYGIVVDSSSDLIANDFQNKEIDFTIVPLKIVTDEQEFVDGNEIDIEELLRRMSASSQSTSSCPSPHDFLEAFKKSDSIICITMTSGLSGTHNSARLAATMLNEEFPDKKIAVIDTKSTAGSMILVVEKANELIKANVAFESIVEQLEEYSKTLHLVFTLGSYDNLVKTGRMSNFVKTIAIKMNIKVICRADENGQIEITKKIRGSNKLFKTMIDLISNYKDLTDTPVYIHHCKSEESVNDFSMLLKEKWPTCKIIVKNCKALTTFYAMPGGMLVSF